MKIKVLHSALEFNFHVFIIQSQIIFFLTFQSKHTKTKWTNKHESEKKEWTWSILFFELSMFFMTRSIDWVNLCWFVNWLTIERIYSVKYGWFMACSALRRRVGRQTRSFCSKSRPLEFSTGTTWLQLFVGGYTENIEKTNIYISKKHM